jgi:hypothetical protein
VYLLKFFHDDLSSNSEVLLQAQHSILYVWRGAAIINGDEVGADSAVYAQDVATIRAGAEGATFWRWELGPKEDALHLLNGDGVLSTLRMSRKIKMFELVPTSKWLFRLDSVIESEGSTGLHSHAGSGIRCLVSGRFHVQSEKGEESVSHNPGDAWYEEGAYPVVSTSDPGVKTTFLRAMVLPPEFAQAQSVIWIEGKPGNKVSGRKLYVQKVVSLR